MKTRASHDLGLSLQLQKLSSQSQSSLLSLWWSRYLWLHYCVVDIFFVLVESDESRLGILPFFSLPPFCLFCYHCSLSLYFAKYSCTFRSSVLFCFASLPLFLQFIGEFLFMCRVCCETQFVWANYQLCTHVLLYVLVSFLGFIFVCSWQVAGTRDPPEKLARVPGRRNTRNRHPYNNYNPSYSHILVWLLFDSSDK